MEISFHNILIPLCIVLAAGLGFVSKKIDLMGAISGTILAYIIWLGGGAESLLALFLFFILGTLASSWKKGIKNHYKLAQENDGKRGISNVLANGGVAGILALFSLIFSEYQDLFKLMIIASFATACSDTLSSELGNIYGKRYFNIINFKPSPRGVDGAISIQGLIFGLIGSLLIAASTLPFYNSYKVVFILAISGLSGNIVDSILGATLQRRGYLNNHQVNFWATGLGALIALILYFNIK